MGYDVIIIGGGIIGLSTGYNIIKTNPRKKILILEKEQDVGMHQTGHNSGVIHSGIYYRPDSLKAQLCRKGIEGLSRFCIDKGIRYEMCGKVIIATDKDQISSLDLLMNRGADNGIQNLKKLSKQDIKTYEPYAEGEAGIFCPETGIIDYKEVCYALKEEVKKYGEIKIGHCTTHIDARSNRIRVIAGNEIFKSNFLINCAGLFSDKIAKLAGMKKKIKIVPFRGEYYSLKNKSKHLVKNLIYPVPNPLYPFLGVHFTRTINKEIECGPNAVLAFSREGYNKMDININHMLDYLSFKGFWKFVKKNWHMGLNEYIRSFSKEIFVKDLKKLIPEIEIDDLVASPSGVRAQAMDENGVLVDDFAIHKNRNMIHVIDSPSPAATSSFSIGEYISSLYSEMTEY